MTLLPRLSSSAALGLVLLFVPACKSDDGERDKKERSDDDDAGKKKKKKKKANAEKEGAEDDAKVTIGDDGLPRLPDGSIRPPREDDWKFPDVGMWVRSEPTKESKGGVTTTVALLEKRKDDEYLIQGDIQQPGMPLQFQAWVRVSDLKNPTPESMALLEVKSKIMGRVQTLPAAASAPIQKQFQSFLTAANQAKKTELPQEDVKTPLGLFRQCYKTTETVTAYGITATSTVFKHPALFGAAVRVESDGTIIEAVATGKDGAKRLF